MLLKSISISAIIILVVVTIAALAEESQDVAHTGLAPNAYVDSPGLPAPVTFPGGN